MGIIKKIAVILGLFIALAVAIGLFLPATTEVSREVVISRDVDSVFAMVNDYREFNKWSPWAKRDLDTKYEFSGPAIGAGAKMRWQSDHPQVGSGSQEIVESIPNQKISVRLHFDGQGEANAYYLLEPQEGGTKITWGFSTEHGLNLVSRYFGLMFDTWVGADYEAGLQNLKKLLEQG